MYVSNYLWPKCYCQQRKGYPKGLKGKDIPLEARILAIADAFAAMTSERCYSNTLSYEQALEKIMKVGYVSGDNS